MSATNYEAPTPEISRLVELTEEKRKLQADLKQINEEIAKVEPEVSEWLLSTGTQRVGLKEHTVYQSVQTSASVKPEYKQQAVEAAKALDLDYMIVLQPASLSSYCREMLADPGSELPEELRDCVSVYEKTRVNVRRA